MAQSSQSFCDTEMHMVPLAQGKPDRQTGINAHRSARSNEKVSTTEIPSDCSCFFLCEITWPLVRAKCRRRGASKCAIVIIILMLAECGRSMYISQGCLSKCRYTRSYKIVNKTPTFQQDQIITLMRLILVAFGIWICTCCADTSF
jgi:hypothetical protein